MGIFDQRGQQEQQGRQQGGGFGGRLFIAVIIALIGFLMYMSHQEENPVTHKKQHVSINPNEEIRLGLESAPVMTQQMGGEVPASDPRAQAVQKMGQYIVDNTAAKNSPWKFKFHLLADDKTINAFALPGGQIFITLGLFNKLQSEAQLAGVLSHEMGHVIERHTAQQMAKSQLGESLVMAVGTAAASDQSSSYHAQIVASIVNQMMQLRYSRQDESEADVWGVMLMTQVGYNPKAMIEVLEILKAAGPAGRGPEMLQTHPNPDLRIKQIKEYLKNHPIPENVKEGQKLRKE